MQGLTVILHALRISSGKRHRFAALWSGLLALVLAGSLLVPARADDDVHLTSSHLHAVHAERGIESGAYLDAQFAIALPPSLRDAVVRGVPLYFEISLDISRSRWYWFDKHLVTLATQTKLSYSPLTRQYRLTRGGLAQPFDTLDQALLTLQKIVQWRVGETHVLDGGAQARLRFRLDTSMLPKPFQLSAMTDHDWTLDSDWQPVVIKSEPASAN
jgi:hypothetical protein